MVPYEGQKCTTCGGDVYLEKAGALTQTVDLFCEACGFMATEETKECRGPHCHEQVFFGGKSGKSPICVRTGSSHFIDCVDAQQFRRAK